MRVKHSRLFDRLLVITSPKTIILAVLLFSPKVDFDIIFPTKPTFALIEIPADYIIHWNLYNPLHKLKKREEN
jgi:hypothetical protein